MLLGARTAMWQKAGGGISLPAVKVESAGILNYTLSASISPPYSIAMWVRQNEYQPSSLTLSQQPLFFSCGGESTGIGIGKTGQHVDWCNYFAVLNQPRYWARGEGYKLADNRDWHYVITSVKSGSSPFSMWVDGEKMSFVSNQTMSSVGTTPSGAKFTLFGRTAAGTSASYDSQWHGSIANIAFYNRAISDSSMADVYGHRFDQDPTASHFWECTLANGGVVDLVGNFDFTAHGTVVQDVPLVI